MGKVSLCNELSAKLPACLSTRVTHGIKEALQKSWPQAILNEPTRGLKRQIRIPFKDARNRCFFLLEQFMSIYYMDLQSEFVLVVNTSEISMNLGNFIVFAPVGAVPLK